MGTTAKLRPEQHSSLPWQINEIVSDFNLTDAWALPAEGSLEEFDDLCRIFSSIDPSGDTQSGLSRTLFSVRHHLGERLGWDKSVNTLPIPGCRESSLRDRLPRGLAAETSGTAGRLPFRPVFRSNNEWALELSNSTVHAALHLGWVPQADDSYQGQMGIYVKPRGRLGGPYMAAIAPFRHHVVYPALLRRIDHAWANRSQ